MTQKLNIKTEQIFRIKNTGVVTEPMFTYSGWSLNRDMLRKSLDVDMTNDGEPGFKSYNPELHMPTICLVLPVQ